MVAKIVLIIKYFFPVSLKVPINREKIDLVICIYCLTIEIPSTTIIEVLYLLLIAECQMNGWKKP